MQDLMDESRRSEIRNCLTIIQLCLPPFSQAMQEFVKNPDKKDMEVQYNKSSLHFYNIFLYRIEKIP